MFMICKEETPPRQYSVATHHLTPWSKQKLGGMSSPFPTDCAHVLESILRLPHHDGPVAIPGQQNYPIATIVLTD